MAKFAETISFDMFAKGCADPKAGSCDPGRQTALRHGIWAATMSYELGVPTAFDFLRAHEVGHPDPDGNKSPDVRNNPLGVSIGQYFAAADSNVLGIWRIESFNGNAIAQSVIKHLNMFDTSG